MDFYWLWAIPVLGLLVFVHELGHFITARLVGIRVLEFGFGFPPRVLSVTRGGVVYSLNLIPLGGFVKMLGENGDSSAPDSFAAKPAPQRALVLAAGSIMNFLTAVVIFAVVAATGLPTITDQVRISEVFPGTPAERAGLQPGDLVVSMGGEPIRSTDGLRNITSRYLGEQVELEVQRGNQRLTVTLVPRKNPPQGEGPMGVRIEPVIQYIAKPVWEAVPYGFARSIEVLGMFLYGIVAMIRGIVAPEVAGPIGIAQLTGEVARLGGLIPLANLAALLSLNLFAINLLPLPALDGGRLLFVILEIVRGKRIPPEREGRIHFVGIVVLISLAIIISYLDILRIASGRSIAP